MSSGVTLMRHVCVVVTVLRFVLQHSDAETVHRKGCDILVLWLVSAVRQCTEMDVTFWCCGVFVRWDVTTFGSKRSDIWAFDFSAV